MPISILEQSHPDYPITNVLSSHKKRLTFESSIEGLSDTEFHLKANSSQWMEDNVTINVDTFIVSVFYSFIFSSRL